jgi:hypothetical protein
MEATNTNFIAKIRSNYNLLLFLILLAIPLILWWLLMLLPLRDGRLFMKPDEMGMDIFMVFFLPLIAAPLISGLSLLIAKAITVRVLRWLVIVGLGVIIPISAFAYVFLGHVITRKFYLGNKRNMPGILAVMTNNESGNENKVVPQPAEKLAHLKEMLNQGLISRKDYETKKTDILSKM